MRLQSRSVRRSAILALLLTACAMMLPADKHGTPAFAQPTDGVVPIVNGYGLLLGGTRSGNWLSWKQTHGLLKGGEKYRFHSLKGALGESPGGKPALSEASGAAYTIPFPDRKFDDAGGQIGLGGRWNPSPRPATAIDGSRKVYVDAVSEVLRNHGLARAKPRIVRAYRVDLDGKGRDAVVIEAASPGYTVGDGIGTIKAGAYSFVMLRTLVNGVLKSFVLAGEFARRTSAGPAQKFGIADVLDLNGDGILEVVVETSYYEGGGDEVYEVKNGSPRLVLKVVDGA